jgi:hypothetical protein
MRKNNQKGQALIELIIFLPLMFMFYSMISGFANAINASINQQKVTRAYFYYRAQNNSTIPKPDKAMTYKPWTQFGMFFIGWKDYFKTGDEESGKPFAPCYRLTVPIASSPTDPPCSDEYTLPATMLIRVQTVYGVCGATYIGNGTVVNPVPDYPGGDFSALVSRGSCTIQ